MPWRGVDANAGGRAMIAWVARGLAAAAGLHPALEPPGRFSRRVSRLAALLVTGAQPVIAQGVRISGTTAVDYAEIQPIVLDSVPISATVDSGLLRHTANGTVVECLGSDQYCGYYRSAGIVSTAPIRQELTATAWGIAPGLSAYADAEVRTAVGSAGEIWPLSNQHFDLFAAYGEYDATGFRARLGRQWTTSPLGYYAYDGASVFGTPLAGLSAEIYGGWGLAQALTYPRTSSAISAVEELAPSDRGYIIGATIDYSPARIAGITVQYQREIATDFSGLYSERIAGSANLQLGRALVNGQVVYDIATGDVNDARLRADVPLGRQWGVSAEVRHYVPFFELWTIWGAFSPVGYGQGRLTAHWTSSDQRIRLEVDGDYRQFANTDAGLTFLPLRSNGFDVGAAGSWRVVPAWSVSGGYHVIVGPGASRSDFNAGVQWHAGDRTTLGLTGTAFQTIDEFSVGTGRVWGLAVDGGVRIFGDLRADGDAGVYRNTGEDMPQIANWNQARASVRLVWVVGRDPGMSRMHW